MVCMDNPFRIHGTVRPPYFADREEERTRIRAALREGGTKLLVYGERRMGKTSAVELVADELNAAGGSVVVADLSTATTVADMANRILQQAGRVLGRRWKDVASELVRSIGVSLKMSPDPLSGVILPSLELGARQASIEEQRDTLGRILDSLDAMAAVRKRTLGLVLDEFQEIHTLGGEDAEWHLRGIIQRHQHVSYILSGSKPHLIHRMLEKGRAFYGLLDKLELGPIDPFFMAAWIEGRMREAGVECAEVGHACASIAGPRTRDVVQLARKTFDLACSGGAATEETVGRAFTEIVEEEDGPIRAWWSTLRPRQQNVVRAIAGADAGLTSAAVLRRFTLGSSSHVIQTARVLLDDGYLVRGGPSGYVFDSPFVRGWIVRHTLPDIGLHLSTTDRPDDPYPPR
jgi:AAA+ ATPase superfamily predicted ATPase